MQPLKNFIGPTIRIGREILCLPYAGFFCTKSRGGGSRGVVFRTEPRPHLPRPSNSDFFFARSEFTFKNFVQSYALKLLTKTYNI